MPNKQDKKGRSKNAPPFVMLPHWVMDTVAWRSLTPQGRAVHLELIRLYNGRNNGFLGLSARDAALKCNIAKDTATRAFRELAERGFIEVATPGAFSLKLRHAAEYRLTHFRCDKTAAPANKAFLRWRAEMAA